MPDFAVSTAFTAKDRVTKAFGSMGKGADKFGRKSSKAFQKASRSGGGFLSKLGSMRTLIAGAGAALATGLAARTVNNIASIGDEAAKTGRQIGTTAETLQELRFAADRQGVSSEVLTKSLQLLNRNVGDLKAGQGTLTTMLKRTNPALAEQLKNVQTNEEAFNIFIKEINKLPSQMEKAALAQAAFGRGGQEILKIAEAGTAGIKDLREEARKYGNIVSDEAAAKSEKYVDALTNLKAAAKGTAVSLVTDLVPGLTKVFQSTADLIVKNKALIATRIDQGIDLAKQAFQAALPFLKLTFRIMSALLPVIQAFLPIMPVLVGGWIAYAAALKAVSIIQAIAGFAKFIGVLRGMAGTMGIVNAVMAANPIGAVILGITLLIAAGVSLIKNWDAVKQGFKDTMAFITKGIDKIAGLFGFNIFGKTQQGQIKTETEAEKRREAPNAAKVEGQQIGFKGQLNIKGAPEGSTVESETTGAPPINVDLLGANA